MHDKKRLYVMFVAACCAVSAAWAKPVSEAGLKIMSFNVRHCEGMDGRIDVARTAAHSPEFSREYRREVSELVRRRRCTQVGRA